MTGFDSPLVGQCTYEDKMFKNSPKAIVGKDRAFILKRCYANWCNTEDVSDGLDWARGLEVAEYLSYFD